MAVAGFNIRVRKSGDSTSTTAEACTSLGSNRYQITTAARRCLNPDAVANFVDSGTTTILWGTGVATIDWQFGIVTLVNAPSGAVTYYGSYLPLTTSSEDVAEGTKMSLSLSRDLYDTTVFGQSVRSRIGGLKDTSISLDVISSPASYSAMFDSYNTGSRVCLEIDPDGASGSGEVFRGFVQIESLEKTGSVDGLIESTVSFVNNSRKDFYGFTNPGYSWG